MDTNNWMMGKQEALQLLRKQEDYNLVKKSVIESIENYMKSVESGNVYTQNLVKHSSALNLIISYCDQIYIIDFSDFCVIDDRFYSCIKAYKRLSLIGGDERQPEYRQLFDFLCTDGDYIYKNDESCSWETSVDFFIGVSAFIMYVVSKTFD